MIYTLVLVCVIYVKDNGQILRQVKIMIVPYVCDRCTEIKVQKECYVQSINIQSSKLKRMNI